jgi:hypothetical protein
MVEDVPGTIFPIHLPPDSFCIGDGEILLSNVLFSTEGIGAPRSTHHPRRCIVQEDAGSIKTTPRHNGVPHQSGQVKNVVAFTDLGQELKKVPIPIFAFHGEIA